MSHHDNETPVHQTITPTLVIHGADKAIEFYKRVFGAEETMRMNVPGGSDIMHAELRIGSSKISLNDEFNEMGSRSPESLGGTTVSIQLSVDDVDAVVAQAAAEGARILMPVKDMFWGDRYGVIVDPFGHQWGIGTHKEDLTAEEMEKRAAEFFAEYSRCKE